MSSKSSSPIRELCGFDSESEDDYCISTLQSESKLLATTIEKLKNFKPETKSRVGRPKKNTTQTSNLSASSADVLPDIVKLLESITVFTSKILKKVEQIEKNSLSPSNKTINSYNLRGSLIDSKGQATVAPLFSEIVAGSSRISTNPGISQLQDRVDQVEQDSLKNFVKIEGEACRELLNKVEKKEKVDLKKEVNTAVSKIVPHLETEVVESVTVVGKNKKHFKIKINSFHNKVSILKKFKESKPNNLFISEYITKTRSLLLYKLKQLKKNNPCVKSVYVFGGNVCAKLADNPRYFIINSSEYFNKFINILNKTPEQINNSSNE